MKAILKKRRRGGERYGRILFKILKMFPDFISIFFLDLFRNNPFTIGYAFRWAAYKKICRHIGTGVVFSPNSYIYDAENISIGNDCMIHPFVYITCGKTTIDIGDNAAIASNCVFATNKHNFEKYDKATGFRKKGNTYKPIVVGNNVWIGTNCVILGGADIGEGAVIGASSLVNSVIPPFTVCVGSPAKPVKKIDVIYE